MIRRVAAVFAAGFSLTASLFAAPTFHKDILPILQNRCQSCHRTGEVGPMPLFTYSQVRPWAKAIKTALLAGTMPPWSPDKRYGKFANDLSMPASERELLVSWIDSGAAEGTVAEAPAPKHFTDGWTISKPDVVFELPEVMTIPATGVINYQYIAVPTHFTEDKWVQMLEVRPTDRSVVHHAIVTVDSGYGGMGAHNYLAGYAPGMTPQVWQPGTARLIKAGSTLIFQMHYTTTGKPATDRTKIGLVFAKTPPTTPLVGAVLANGGLHIAAGDANARVDAEMTLNRDFVLWSILPHTHVRGKRWTYEATFPDGRKQTLLSVPNYNFDWQTDYIYKEPVKLPKGTVVHATAWYDNSAANKSNPDPTKDVWWGDQTFEEMMFTALTMSVAPAPPPPTAGQKQ